MVEVWLPYDEDEISVMLPDPIELYVSSVPLSPKKTVDYNLLKIAELLSKLESVKILRTLFDDPVQLKIVDNILKQLGLKYEFVESSFSVAIGVLRFDPIFKLKGSIVKHYLMLRASEALREVQANFSVTYPEDLSKYADESVHYIDILVDRNGRPVDLFYSNDGSHWSKAKEEYILRYSLKKPLSTIVIASAGGTPWCEDLLSVLQSMAKVVECAPKNSLIVFVGGSSVEESEANYYQQGVGKLLVDTYVRYLSSLLLDKKTKVFYYGSLPGPLTNLKIKIIDDVESLIHSLPAKYKRSTTVIESAPLIHPPTVKESSLRSEGEFDDRA